MGTNEKITDEMLPASQWRSAMLAGKLLGAAPCRTTERSTAPSKVTDPSGNLMGKRPTASELTTTAGRVFWISVSTVGSKLTSQISPRCGVDELGLDNIASLPPLAFGPF